MHTGFVMVPQMIKSPSTALVLMEENNKKLPMVVEKTSTAITKI